METKTGRSANADRVALTATLASAAIAVVVLGCWLGGTWTFVALGLNYVPMAPSTALAVLALAAGLLLAVRGHQWLATRWLVPAIAAGVGLLALWVWLRTYYALQLPDWLLAVRPEVKVGDIRVGLMSPYTATVLAVLALALALLVATWPRRWGRQAVALLALLALLATLSIGLSYLVNEPLFYGGQTIPMALLTAVALALQGVGLLAAAGSDLWPLAWLRPSYQGSAPPHWRQVPLGPATVFLLFCAIFVVASVFYLKSQLRLSRLAAEKELAAIADLKTDQLAAWYQERVMDGEAVARNWLTTGLARRGLAAGPGSPEEQEFLAWMRMRRELNDYERIVLYDAAGRGRLTAAAPHADEAWDPSRELGLAEALAAKRVVVTDLHPATQADCGAHFNVWIPLPHADGPPAGVLLLQMDPGHFLFPMLRAWPTASRSAESLLVRREEDGIFFLSELRHWSGPPMSLRLPLLPGQNLPAAQAVYGRAGEIDGQDYRGVPVLASVRAVPGTPWFLVAKVDQEEVYAPWRERAWWVGGLLLALIAGTGVTIGLLWRQRDLTFVQRQLALERERQASERQFRTIFEQAGVGVARVDTRSGRFLQVNQRYCEITGYSAERMLQLAVPDITHPDDLPRQQAAQDALLAGQTPGYSLEKRYRRADGQVVWVSLNVAPLWLPGESPEAHIAVVQDISARKQAEAENAAKTRLLRLTGEMAQIGAWEFDVATLQGTWTEEVARIHDLPVDTPINVAKGLDYYAPAARPQIDEAVRRIIADGTPYDLELELISATGRHRWVRTSGYPVYGEDGRILRVHGLVQDVTTRHEAEQARRQSEQLYRLLAENMQDVVWILNPETMRFRYMSPSVMKLRGVSAEESLAAPATAGLLPPQRDEVATELRERAARMRAGETIPDEVRELEQPHANGGTVWTEIATHYYLNPETGLPEIHGVSRGIDARKRADLQLRESEERYRSLFENMIEGFAYCRMLFDANGEPVDYIHLAINSAFSAITGLKDVIGRPITEILPGLRESNADLFAVYGRVAKTGRPERFETYVPGMKQWFAIAAYSNQPGHFVVVFDDITARRQAEAELRETRDYLDNLLNCASAPIIVWDAQRRITRVNRAFENLTGRRTAAVLGQDSGFLFPIDQRETSLQAVADACAGKRWQGLELLVQHADHTVRTLLWNSANLTAPDGKSIVATIAQGQDITERKRAEERIRTVAKTVPVVIFEFCRYGDELAFTFVSDRIVDIAGIPAMSVLIDAENLFSLIVPEDRAAARDGLREATRSLQRFVHEFRLARPDGNQRWLAVDAVLQAGDQSTSVWTGYLQDITERHQAEQEVRQLNAVLEQRVRERTAQLEASNRELEAYSTSISHDLRAPLRGIDGWSLALLEDYGDKLDPQARDYLQRVRAESQRMGQLIDDLLQLARAARVDLNLRAVDLSALAETIAERLQAAWPGRRLEFAIQPGLCVQGDARLLEVALSNLFDNACKFTARREVAHIEFGMSPPSAGSVAPVYWVRDNGAGFDMAYVSRLFGVFQRLHPVSQFPGTGIGLAIVQRVVQRHGGRAWGEGRLDQGATFFFTLKENP